jgi:hypothetical protein
MAKIQIKPFHRFMSLHLRYTITGAEAGRADELLNCNNKFLAN